MRNHSNAKEDPTVVRSVSLPRSMFDRLAATKERTGVPQSEVMRRALAAYFAAQSQHAAQ